MKNINITNEDPLDNYRERLAADNVWDNLTALQTIRWDIANDEDLDESDEDKLLATVNRMIKALVARRLDDEF